MALYYVLGSDGQESGPFDEETLMEMNQQGAISLDKSVRLENSNDYQPLSNVIGEPDQSEEYDLAEPAMDDEPIYCPNCSERTSLEDLVSVGNTQVCPSCKEEYVQRLKEGTLLNNMSYDFAGGGIRFAARFIDGIILQAIQYGLMFLGVFSMSESIEGDGTTQILFIYGMSILIPLMYYTFFTGHPKLQATPGKLVCRVKVIQGDGSQIGYGRAAGRFFADMLSGITLGIGYLMCLFDEEKRCLHDRIVNTRVVRL